MLREFRQTKTEKETEVERTAVAECNYHAHTKPARHRKRDRSSEVGDGGIGQLKPRKVSGLTLLVPSAGKRENAYA